LRISSIVFQKSFVSLIEIRINLHKSSNANILNIVDREIKLDSKSEFSLKKVSAA